MQNLPVKQYNSNETLYLRDIISIRNDLQEVIANLTAYINLDNEENQQNCIIKNALWYTALIIYFRCFGGDRRKYKLKKEIYANWPGTPIEFFDYLKNLRDKTIAHSIAQLEETLLGVVIDPLKREIVGHADFSIKLYSDSKQLAEDLLDMAKHALLVVTQEYTIADDELKKNLAICTYEEARKWPNLRYDVPAPAIAVKTPRKQKY